MPITEFPPIAPGNWDSLNNLLLAGWLTITKPADETRTASAGLVIDDTLKFYMRNGTSYRIRGVVWFDTVANADFKYALDSPGIGQVIRGSRVHCAAGGTPTYLAVDTAAPLTSLTGAGTTGGLISFNFTWRASSTPGYWALSWAQDTSDPGNTTVLAGSYIEYQVVA